MSKAATLRFLSDYGMLVVLVLLCLLFSLLTLKPQPAGGRGGADRLANQLERAGEPGDRVLLVAGATLEDRQFLDRLRTRLVPAGFEVVDAVSGAPVDARRAVERLAAEGAGLDWIACPAVAARWPVWDAILDRDGPGADAPRLIAPRTGWGSDFLKPSNLSNITGQMAIIAIIAIGMTFVIITAGIDLSVGSLVALSAVTVAWLIRAMGGAGAGFFAVLLACLLAIGLCLAVGGFTGSMVTRFSMPPFIVTLAIMLVARGVAQRISASQTIYEVPDGFTWLGRDASLLGLPNAAVLMILLYVLAHLVLSRTAYGRYVYAVGGNREAARLSGVPVQRVVLSVYAISGALAGLGGVMLASQLKSGSHTWGVMLELDVIAAVVVGGASLAGGVGKMPGTLIGAFIIAVIGNGMNLLGLEDSWQNVVRGSVILVAVWLDQVKNRTLRVR